MSQSISKRILVIDDAGRPTGNSSRTPSASVIAASAKWAASRKFLLATFAFILLSTSARSTTSVSTVDGGGQRTLSANYTMDGSIESIGGISAALAPATTMRHGYIGQLYEVIGVDITAIPNPVSELSNAQLSATATLDDTTVIALSASNVDWGSAGIPYPLSSVSASGVATATNIYQDTSTAISGYYLGATGNATLFILDTNPDDYGIYAGDGIPDSWQVQYFGVDNPQGVASADADGTGQANLFKYVAGLDPTNPTSVFVLKIASVTGQPTQKNLIYNPVATGRTYTLQFRTNLVSDAWATLTGISDPQTNGNQVTVTDLNATNSTKFYRLDISLP